MPEVTKTERRGGYEVRWLLYAAEEIYEGSPEMTLTIAYALDGGQIGELERAEYLITERGILPERREREGPSETANVGFCEREQKWYGWSHRAICSFGIGDRLFDDDWVSPDLMRSTEAMPYTERGAKIIATLDEARRAASNFAVPVS